MLYGYQRVPISELSTSKLVTLCLEFQSVTYLQQQFTLSAQNAVVVVIVIILIIYYYAPPIIITFLFLIVEFVHFNSSSYQHAQLQLISVQIQVPDASAVSNYASSEVIVSQFLFVAIILQVRIMNCVDLPSV